MPRERLRYALHEHPHARPVAGPGYLVDVLEALDARASSTRPSLEHLDRPSAVKVAALREALDDRLTPSMRRAIHHSDAEHGEPADRDQVALKPSPDWRDPMIGDRIIRRLLDALGNEYAWLFIGMLTLAILWVWFVTSGSPSRRAAVSDRTSTSSRYRLAARVGSLSGIACAESWRDDVSAILAASEWDPDDATGAAYDRVDEAAEVESADLRTRYHRPPSPSTARSRPAASTATPSCARAISRVAPATPATTPGSRRRTCPSTPSGPRAPAAAGRRCADR